MLSLTSLFQPIYCSVLVEKDEGKCIMHDTWPNLFFVIIIIYNEESASDGLLCIYVDNLITMA